MSVAEKFMIFIVMGTPDTYIYIYFKRRLEIHFFLWQKSVEILNLYDA